MFCFLSQHCGDMGRCDKGSVNIRMNEVKQVSDTWRIYR